MAVKTVITDVQVIVDVDTWYMNYGREITETQARKAAEAVMSDIKRHVDGFSGLGWRCERITQCEFCGRDPEPNEAGCPCCCDKAVSEWDRDHSDHGGGPA